MKTSGLLSIAFFVSITAIATRVAHADSRFNKEISSFEVVTTDDIHIRGEMLEDSLRVTSETGMGVATFDVSLRRPGSIRFDDLLVEGDHWMESGVPRQNFYVTISLRTNEFDEKTDQGIIDTYEIRIDDRGDTCRVTVSSELDGRRAEADCKVVSRHRASPPLLR